MHEHTHFWRCFSHPELGQFSKSEEYIQHIQKDHNTKLSENQLHVLLNRNTRRVAKLFHSCPLCGQGETEIDGRLEDHIAGHLRYLALKSLPNFHEEMLDDTSGSGGGSSQKPQDRSTVKNLGYKDDINTLGIEYTGNDWKQHAEQYSTNFMGDPHHDLDPNLQDSHMATYSLVFL